MDTKGKRVRHSRLDCSPGCAIEAAISLIDGKWKCVLLFHLKEAGTLRFGELRRIVTCLTPRMLTNQLRELEADGIITRQVYAQVPPKVEYRLSPRGQSLEPILLALQAWGEANMSLFAPAKPLVVSAASALGQVSSRTVRRTRQQQKLPS